MTSLFLIAYIFLVNIIRFRNINVQLAYYIKNFVYIITFIYIKKKKKKS